MLSGFVKKTLCLSILIGMCACSNVYRGYKIEDQDKIDMQKMVSQGYSKQQIVNELGSPSFINSPMNDTFCYVGAEGRKVAFNRFYKPKYNLSCITFEGERASKITNKTFDQVKVEKFTKYKVNAEKPL